MTWRRSSPKQFLVLHLKPGNPEKPKWGVNSLYRPQGRGHKTVLCHFTCSNKLKERGNNSATLWKNPTWDKKGQEKGEEK